MPSIDSSANQPHPTCVETTTHVELAMGVRSYVCGPDCPRPGAPEPARDARRRVRAERERRRAARALDRYMEIYEQAVAGAGGTLPILTAGERFVEAVGDYVLSELHHNGDYGVAGSPREFCGARREHGAHRWSDYGVPKTCGGLSGEDLRELEGAPVPSCPAHGQPMTAGMVGADGEIEWKCICTLGGGS